MTDKHNETERELRDMKREDEKLMAREEPGIDAAPSLAWMRPK